MAYKTIIDNLKYEKYWSLQNNNLKDEGVKYLSQVLKDTELIKLNLSNNNIGSEGVKYLSQVLKDTELIKLNLSNNNIGSEGDKYLFQVLKNTNITDLDLSNNNIGDEGVKYLSQVITDTVITNLDLSNNNIGDEGVKYLFQVLKETKLTNLDLSNNKISTDAQTAQHFTQILNTKMSLSLDVHYTGGDYGVKYIYLSICSGIISVTIHNNKMGTNGARYFNQIFQNSPIGTLTLDSDTLDDDDAQYLAQAFKNTKINELNMCCNHILQTNGIKYLTQAFRDSQLSKLNLCAQKIKTAGAKCLAEFLKQIMIMSLNLDLNYIKDEGVKYLAPALEINTIMQLDLSWNDIEADGAKYLSQILKDTQITFISLCNNSIGVAGAKYLANGLKYSQVTGIHLHGNMIEYEGYQYLKDVIDDTNLSWVNLHYNGIEEGLGGNKLWPYSIPRNSYTIAYEISNAFKKLVSLNPFSNEFEFIVPRKNTINIDQYVFLINTLKNNPNTKAHIFDEICRKDNDIYDFNIITKVNEFIITLSNKFNEFINNKLPALLEVFDDYNYINLVRQFEDIKLYDIVQNLLLHRGLYYIDDNQEILHPYIYKLLHKYNIILFNTEIEPNKNEQIISYYQNHPEIDGGQEIIDLLRSESFQQN